jgi:hypothetical protein
MSGILDPRILDPRILPFRSSVSDKMSTLLRFVVMPKLEDVMNVTRRNCSRTSKLFRSVMMAQPDPRDHRNQTRSTAQMTTT